MVTKTTITHNDPFIIMYGILFLNVNHLNHIYLGVSRTYMFLVMVLPMIILMIIFMGKMYPKKKLKVFLIVGSLVTFGIILNGPGILSAIGDIQYTKAMIHIKYPEVKALPKK